MSVWHALLSSSMRFVTAALWLVACRGMTRDLSRGDYAAAFQYICRLQSALLASRDDLNVLCSPLCGLIELSDFNQSLRPSNNGSLAQRSVIITMRPVASSSVWRPWEDMGACEYTAERIDGEVLTVLMSPMSNNTAILDVTITSAWRIGAHVSNLTLTFKQRLCRCLPAVPQTLSMHHKLQHQYWGTLLTAAKSA